MDLNLLHPKKAVERAFDKPNFFLAVAVVLLPVVISIFGTLLVGLQLNLLSIVFWALESVIAWITFGILLYVIAFVIEGKQVQGRIVGIFCSLSLLWIVFSIISVLGFLLVAAMPPEVITSVSALQKGQAGANEAYAQVASAINSAADSISPAYLLFFSIASIALMLFALYLVFLTVKDLSPKSLGKQLAILIIFLVAWFLIAAIT